MSFALENRSVNSSLGIVLRWCKYFRTAFEGSMHFRSSSFAFRSLPTLSLSLRTYRDFAEDRPISRVVWTESLVMQYPSKWFAFTARASRFSCALNMWNWIFLPRTLKYFVQRVFNYFAKRLNRSVIRYDSVFILYWSFQEIIAQKI